MLGIIEAATVAGNESFLSKYEKTGQTNDQMQ